MKIKCVFSAFFFYIVFLTSLAHAAAISDTSATLILNWDSVSVEWSSGASFAYNGADADLDGVPDHPSYVGGWVTDPAITLTAQVTADSVGIAETTITSANATAHSKADGIGTTSPPDEIVNTTATSHRGNSFSPHENGEITLSFEYIISHLFSKDLATEGHSGWSIAELNLSYAGTIIGHDEAIVNSETTENDFLSITANLSSDNWYYLEGHVYTNAYARSPEQAAVPIPSSLLLLGSALVGLAGVRKKFKK